MSGYRDQIDELVARYAYLVDQRDIANTVKLFTTGAVLVLPNPPAVLHPVREYTGRDQIAGSFDGLNDILATRHEILGLVTEPTDDGTVAGWVTGQAHHLTARPDGTVADVVWHLRYADRYHMQGARWLISRRELTVDWIEIRPVRHWRALDSEGIGGSQRSHLDP